MLETDDRLAKFKKKVEKANTTWIKENKISPDRAKRITMGSEIPVAKLISTGNPALDWALGGGIPESNIVEFYGLPGSSKSTSLGYIIAEVQKENKIAIYYSTEESKKPTEMWRITGVDEDKVVFIDAVKSGEDGLNLIQTLLFDEDGMPNTSVGIIALDSMAAVEPNDELSSTEKNGLEGHTMGRVSALVSKLFRMVCGSGWLREGCIFVFANQERAQIGTTPLPTVTAGGNAVKYFPKIRIQLKSPKDGFILNENKEVIGQTIEYYVSKNNTGYSHPHKRGSWKVLYGIGIDYLGPIIDEALSYGIIKQTSQISYNVRWLEPGDDVLPVFGNINTKEKLRGRANVESFVKDNPQVIASIQDLISRVRSYLTNSTVKIVDGFAYIDNEEVDLLEIVLGEKEEDNPDEYFGTNENITEDI